MLNQRIKRFMEERGIKQSFLKKQLGMKASAVNSLLNGNRKISVQEYFKSDITENTDVTLRNNK